MNLKQCLFTENDCYKAGGTITPIGVMVHSTGVNNPNLRRYVQPDDGLLGVNTGGSHWNRSGLSVCAHGFIGKLADGSVAAYQTLPWNYRGWHCGTGTSGSSANNTHISFEICEDDLTDSDYFAAVYQEAVELSAYLCGLYGLDPLAAGVVICHSEGYQLGVASNHADVMHWFPQHDKTMDDFRAAVAAEMENDMDQDKFNEMFDARLAELAEQECPEWAKAELQEAVDMGITDGTRPCALIPRYQSAIMAKRATQK